MTTDEILARNSIDNASDAALVRLASAAVSLPDELAETLCKRVNFANKADVALGMALVQAVRANIPTPRPQPSKGKARVAWAILGLVAISASVFATLWLHAQNEADQMTAQMEQSKEASAVRLRSLQTDFAEQLTKLQKQALEAQTQADVSLKGNLDTFTRTVTEQVQRINDLARENERLRLELENAKKASAASLKD